MAEARARDRLSTVGSDLAPRSGLRVRPQRPARALFGLLLVLAAVVAALAIYTRIGDRHEVLAVTRTVLAGEQLTDADLRVVSISSDDSIPWVSASARGSLVGQYAKVRMVEGSLLVAESVQARPLVDPSKVLMSVEVPVARVPVGLREGSLLMLIVMPKGSGNTVQPVLVEAAAVAVPADLGARISGSGSAQSSVALSVEVAPESAVTVGSAESVAVAVVAPDASLPMVSDVSAVPDLSVPSSVAGG